MVLLPVVVVEAVVRMWALLEVVEIAPAVVVLGHQVLVHFLLVLVLLV